MERPVILVVDDSPDILDIIKSILSDSYHIKLATRGDVALKIAQTQKPDLILLDVMMPGMNGYETCIALKNNPKTMHIPVIMISVNNHEDDELIGLNAGAVDYITKPISTAILLARVAHQIQLVLTRRELQKAHNKVLSERVLMEELVHKMLCDNDFDDQFIRYATRSEEINSGDVVLAAFRPDGVQHIIVGDFAGHGLLAAIGVPLVSYIFYSRTHDGISLAKIVDEINTALIDMLPLNFFMGILAAEVDQQRQQVKIWNYGMESILVLTPENRWLSLPSKSVALGIIEINDTAFHHQLELSPKTYIYLFTDGITEAADHTVDQALFGIERLKTSVLNTIQQGLPISMVLDDVLVYANSPTHFDDMTILEISAH